MSILDKLFHYCLSLQLPSHIWGTIFYGYQPHSWLWLWFWTGLPSNSNEPPPFVHSFIQQLLPALSPSNARLFYERLEALPVIHTKVWGVTFSTRLREDRSLATYCLDNLLCPLTLSASPKPYTVHSELNPLTGWMVWGKLLDLSEPRTLKILMSFKGIIMTSRS